MRREVVLFEEKDCTPWRDINLEGQIVILKESFFKPEYRDAKYQLVYCGSGFGCSPTASGNAIFVIECHNDNPEHYRIERCNNDILGIATEEAIAEWKSIYGEFNEKVLHELNKEDK